MWIVTLSGSGSEIEGKKHDKVYRMGPVTIKNSIIHLWLRTHSLNRIPG
jgi:hypothetical protein